MNIPVFEHIETDQDKKDNSEVEASSLYYYVEKMDYNSYGVKFISSNLSKAIKVAISMAMIEEYNSYTYEVKSLRGSEEVVLFEVNKIKASKLLEIIV